MTTIPPDRLTVEVDHPSGHTWTLDPLDDAEFLPTLNGKPELRVPVERNEDRWLSADWEGVEPEMRAWDGSTRLPIDEFIRPEVSPERIVLVGEGGKQLDDPVSVEVSQEEAYLTAQRAVENNTTYTTNFDDPGADTAEERLFQEPSGETALTNALAEPIPATDPFEEANGGHQSQQTCWTVEAEDKNGGTATPQDISGFSDGRGLTFISGSGDDAEWEFVPQYDVPAGVLRIAYRNQGSGSPPSIRWTVNGTEVDVTNELLSISWDIINCDELGVLPAGQTVTVRAEEQGNGTDSRQIDVVAPYDNRWSYTLDNTLSSDDHLDGPQWYPDGPAVVYADSSSVFSITEARVTSTWDSIEDGQQLAVSNDLGANYLTADNTTTLDKTFPSAGASIRFRATLGRQGERDTATPRLGYQPQRIESYTLYGTVEDSPVLRNRRFDTSLLSLLNAVAEYSNSIWELRWDDDAGTIRVEWTRPGAREGSTTSDAVDYRLSKNLRTYGKVTVKGSYQPRTERITADHGSAVDLAKDNLITSRETVADADDDTPYEESADYDIDYDSGAVTTLASGDIEDGQTLAVDYQFEPRASYAADDFDPSTDRELPPQKINSVTTDREAEQAALTIQQDLDSPLYEAEVTVSTFSAGISLIDDLQVGELPVDVGFEIQDQQRQQGQITLQLGSRRRLTEVISNIEQRLAATQERS